MRKKHARSRFGSQGIPPWLDDASTDKRKPLYVPTTVLRSLTQQIDIRGDLFTHTVVAIFFFSVSFLESGKFLVALLPPKLFRLVNARGCEQSAGDSILSHSSLSRIFLIRNTPNK